MQLITISILKSYVKIHESLKENLISETQCHKSQQPIQIDIR